jgi:hypothetical protein
MKSNVLIIMVLFCVPSFLIAQNSAVDKLFDKYSEKEGFTTVLISQYMFEMFKNIETEDKDFDNMVKGLKSIRILTVDNAKLAPAGINFYKEIMKDLPVNDYKELMVIKGKGQDVKFLIKEVQGKISELLLVSGGQSNAFICIQGNIDLKSIAKLSKSMNIEGMKQLENVNEKKSN